MTRPLVLAVVGLALLGGCRPETSAPTTSAAESRSAAITMISDIAAAVSPGSPATAFLPDETPLPCDGSHQSEVYYTLFREFDAPRGTTGASVVPELSRQFQQRGFAMQPQQSIGEGIVQSGRTKTEGLMIRGEDNAPTVTITLDTACGSP